MARMRAPSPRALLVGLALLAACGEPDAAPAPPDPSVALRADLARRIEETPAGPERTTLEIEHAVAVLQGVRRSDRSARLAEAVESLGVLRAEKQAAGDVDAEAQVRVALGRHLSISGAHDMAQAELDWVLALEPESPSAADALFEKAGDLYRRKDFAGSKALLEELLRLHPDSSHAKDVPRGIANCEREIERAR